MNVFAKCDSKDCIQTDCERLEVNGCSGQWHSMNKICNIYNMYMWYEGKNKKENLRVVDGLFETEGEIDEEICRQV